MPIRLIPAAAGEPIKLDKPVLLIGRNPDCDVVLTESRKVSRNHCLIACVDDKLFIRDLAVPMESGSTATASNVKVASVSVTNFRSRI